MRNNYLIVDKRILPDYYEKVVEARAMLRSGSVKEVSEAVKRVGISRSTYYKYKDFIFSPNEDDGLVRRAVISMLLTHKKGVLSDMLNLLSSFGANILTITQSLPIHGSASVVLSLDMTNVQADMDDVIARISACEYASAVALIAIE